MFHAHFISHAFSRAKVTKRFSKFGNVFRVNVVASMTSCYLSFRIAEDSLSSRTNIQRNAVCVGKRNSIFAVFNQKAERFLARAKRKCMVFVVWLFVRLFFFDKYQYFFFS